jgi:hypothetical protein
MNDKNYAKIRFKNIAELVFLRDQIRRYPEQTDWHVKQAILYALPPAYLKLYEWIRQGVFGGTVTTAAVMRAWDWKANYASTMLNELWQFGLLTRTEYTDEHGKGYKYTVGE